MLGNKIRELRKSKNMNQEELSKVINVSRSAVASYEQGIKDPKYEVLIIISNYFNVSIDYLLGVSKIKHREDTTTDEQQLLNYYRELKENDKIRLIERAEALLELKTTKAPAKLSQSNNTNDENDDFASA